MSGHSKWAKVHRKKGVADAKKGAIFTRLGNLITIAAKRGGSDLDSNFKLRLVVEKARTANMPKDNIERAIKRGAGEAGSGVSLEEATYEIFGPAGSTFIIEAITDNKNRTISDLKIALNKNGGRLGEPNSVMWMFDKRGIISIGGEELKKINQDDLELKLIDLEIIDIIKNDTGWEIQTQPEDLQKVEQYLNDRKLPIKESTLTYLPKDELKITIAETLAKIENLFSALNEIDDINNVYTNVTE